jgi:hypothetical protein
MKLRIDLTISDADLSFGIDALRAQREYLLAILANLEGRKAGYDAAEALPLLSKANALERLRLGLLSALKLAAEAELSGDTLETTATLAPIDFHAMMAGDVR